MSPPPCDDDALAALVRRRGLVPEATLDAAIRAARATGSTNGGALARMLVKLRALDPAAVEALAAEAARGPAAAGGAAPRPAGPEATRRQSERLHATQRVPEPGSERRGRPPRFDGASAEDARPEGPPSRGPAAGAPALGATRPLPASDHGRALAHDPDESTARAAARRALGGGVLQDLAPGSRVGGYVVDAEVSRGAMGVVLKAHHADVDGRVVAIKVIAGDLQADADSQRRFQREGEALARLDHPDIVRVYEAGVLADGRRYLAMDFVPGRTLDALAKAEGPLPVERAAALLGRVARAVAFMNRRGVVHRDLKLGNVLLDPAGAPKIADFGLAYVADGRSRLTQQGDLLGTPLYMAPEVVEGALDVDARVDVYALGVMLYRLVVGSYPYYAETSAELFDLVLRSAPAFPADLSRDVRAVLETALARDRARRYPDADALAADLEALAAGRPVTARARTGAERMADALGGSPARLLGLALAALLALLAAGGVVAAARWRARQRAQDVAARADGLDQAREALGAPGGDAAAAALVAARAALAEAEATLAAAARDAVAAAAVDRLAAARGALQGRLAQAEAVAALRRARADQRVDPDERAALAAAFAAAPPGEAAFERVRGEVLLGAGQVEAAARALEGAAAGDPGARAGLAWARLRAGAADAAPAADAGLAPADAAALALGRLAVAPPTEREAARAAARARTAEAPPAARGALEGLLAAAAALEGPADVPALLAALEAVRRASDPPRPPPPTPGADDPPPALRALCCLADGELALRLGWPEAAAEAFARAGALAGDAAWPAAPARAGDDPAAPVTLATPETAARLGEARARARLLEAAPALEAAGAAVARARADDAPAALAAALLLQAEALADAGRGAEARAATDEVAALVERAPAAAPLAPWLFRTQDRAAVVAGERPATAGDAAAAERWLALGVAELAASGPAAQGPPLPPASSGLTGQALDAARAARLPRAERALRLALAADRSAAPGAWAWLARAALARGDLEAAGRAVDRAVAAGGGGTLAWPVLAARGLVAAARGQGPAARADLLAAFEAAAADDGRRLLARAEDGLPLAEDGVRALDRLDPVGALALRDRAARFVFDERLPATVREAHLADAVRRAHLVGDAPRAAEWDARAKATKEEAEEERALYRVAQEYLVKASISDRGESQAAARALLRRSPFEAEFLDANHFAGSELRPEAFHGVSLGFEVRPHMLLAKSDAARWYNRKEPSARDVSRTTTPALAYADQLDEGVPIAPDPDLRRAAAAIWVLETDIPLAPERLLEGLAAAERAVVRRPRCHAAWVARGRLRLAVGDAAGALAALDLAEALPALERRPADERWVAFFRALALGGLRRWGEAETALRAAVAARFDDRPRLRDEEPLLREDRAAAGTVRSTLLPIIEKIKEPQGMEQRRRRQ